MEIRRTDAFLAWVSGLRDQVAKARIATRLDRLSRGLAGDAKPVGQGVSELRIDHGPGYRVYFVQRGAALIILLCGGDKGSQERDIAQAKLMLAELED